MHPILQPCIKTKTHNPVVFLADYVASLSLSRPQHWIHSPEEVLNLSASLKLQRFSSGCHSGDYKLGETVRNCLPCIYLGLI